MQRRLRDRTFGRLWNTDLWRTGGETDGHTNGRTQDHSIYRASIASRGKKQKDPESTYITVQYGKELACHQQNVVCDVDVDSY